MLFLIKDIHGNIINFENIESFGYNTCEKHRKQAIMRGVSGTIYILATDVSKKWFDEKMKEILDLTGEK